MGYGFNFRQQYFAANGYFVLDTNVRSSTGYGNALKWATWGAWGTRDGQGVIAGVDHVIATYPIDRAKVATMGHSYGGFMTNWPITQYPDRFAAAASGASISNWFSDYGTADIYSHKGNRVFRHAVAEGRDRADGEQMYFALRRQGMAAKMIQYAGQPHGISGHWNNVHRMLNELKWIDTFVKKAPASTATSARQ